MSNELLYRKFLLNRNTASKDFITYFEQVLVIHEESAKHCFHKIIVRNWNEDDIHLFKFLSEFFDTSFVPLDYIEKNEMCSFYTSSLTLVMKIMKLDFMFPYSRNMFSVNIIFNDKTSADFFGRRATIDDIVSSIVSNRFNGKMELNLSNFCNDPEFVRTKIHFYKFDLLANFKILMLRMGRDTKILNLSYNNLINVPIDIMNFFIKGDLIGLNLSNNNIQTIQEQFRVSSKIEKLWLEGNPLCEEMDLNQYFKQIIVKFPRLKEIDGIRINEHGILFPMFKQFSVTTDKKTKLVVEKFLHLYFSHYDTSPHSKIEMFYDMEAVLTLTINLTDNGAHAFFPHYARSSRNAINPTQRELVEKNQRMFTGRQNIVALLSRFPETEHDLSTFTVDVILNDNKCMVLVVNGIFREKGMNNRPNYIHFTRTFVFSEYKIQSTYAYHITNEMFNISLATKEQKDNSFKHKLASEQTIHVMLSDPVAHGHTQHPKSSVCVGSLGNWIKQNPTGNYNGLRLSNPSDTDLEVICKMFMHLTMLRKSEAERRLQNRKWDLRLTLMDFVNDLKANKISQQHLLESENSLLDVDSMELD